MVTVFIALYKCPSMKIPENFSFRPDFQVYRRHHSKLGSFAYGHLEHNRVSLLMMTLNSGSELESELMFISEFNLNNNNMITNLQYN